MNNKYITIFYIPKSYLINIYIYLRIVHRMNSQRQIKIITKKAAIFIDSSRAQPFQSRRDWFLNVRKGKNILFSI